MQSVESIISTPGIMMPPEDLGFTDITVFFFLNVTPLIRQWV